MAPFTLNQIKIERLLLAFAATFLIADNVPHPNLGASLTSLGLHEVQHLVKN